MDKQKKELIGVIILLIVFAFVLVNIYKKPASKVATMETKQLSLPSTAKGTIDVLTKEKIQDNNYIKDPFQLPLDLREFLNALAQQPKQKEAGPGVAQTALPKFTLQGIILSDKIKEVIINNKVVKLGESIDGAKVVDITKGKVQMLHGQTYFTLEMSNQLNPPAEVGQVSYPPTPGTETIPTPGQYYPSNPAEAPYTNEQTYTYPEEIYEKK